MAQAAVRSLHAGRGGIVKRCAQQVPHSVWHLRSTTVAAIAACAALTVSACGGSDDQPKASSESPSEARPSARTPSPAEPSADAGAPIAAAYQKYWDAKVAAYAKASVEGTELKKYAVAEAYSQAETEVKALRSKGLVATGKPVLAPDVTSVDTGRKVPRGALTDCTDVSQWTLINRSSGEKVSLPDNRRTKYVTKAVAEKWYGRWVIVKITPENRSC
ncbi:hypothetical protein [Streptomyces sp. NPDC056628]|uniref:hypothetical protein n=1 Tax=Streptomyces sp. NPDC056628 TaxID=3345882 RepID=UPI0036A14810